MNSYQNFSVKKNKVNLVFIDSNIENLSHIFSGVKPGIEAFLMNGNEDGVKLITDVLSQYNNIDSIHIVSHGRPGTLYLGNNQLSLDTLNDYAGELQSWFNSESDDVTPALVLYGCNVAVGDAGSEFLEKLNQITKATIYASSTPVGNSAKGGNWNLDVCRGKVHNSLSLALKSEVLETYTGVFTTGSDKLYTYYDSQEDKGKVNFTDISSDDGILINDISNKTGVFEEKVSPNGFSFKFYDGTYTSITVSNNGVIKFGDSKPVGNFNRDLNRSNLTNSIFPFWDDLEKGNIYYKYIDDINNINDRLIIQWDKVFHADAGDDNGITFQVILHQNSNNIDFVYKDVDFGINELNNAKSATIGIQKDDKSGIEYSYNESSLNEITSISFKTEPILVDNTITVSERVEEQEKILLTDDNFEATGFSSSDDKIKFIISNPQNGFFEVGGQVKTEFTQAQINAGEVKFVHNGGENAPSFDIKVKDDFNETDVKSVNTTSGIKFTNVNDKPVLTGFTNPQPFSENLLNQAAANIYSNNTNIDVTDADSPDFNGGNLTVTYQSGGGQEDQLSIAKNGGSISFDGNNVSFNGAVIGTVGVTNNGSDGKNLVVNFNSTNVTPEAVEALIKNLTYQNTSDTPQPSRTISITVNDGGDDKGNPGVDSIAVTTEIKVNADNDSPVNILPKPETDIDVDEDKLLTFTGDKQISIGDVDAGNRSVQVTLTAANGVLSLNGTTGLNFNAGQGDGTEDPTLQFTGTITDINNALNGMTFKPDLNFNDNLVNNNLGNASIEIKTDDLSNSGFGGNLTDTDTINITVNPVNDAPENTVPAPQSTDEDTEQTITGISIKDVDVTEGDGNLKVTLAVTKGSLKLNNTNGITFAGGNNNNGNAAITFSGKLSDINAVLAAGVIYKGSQNFNGDDTLTITTNDLGNEGFGGAKETKNTVKITVNAANDAPENTVPKAQTVDEDKDLVFSPSKNPITIKDIDFDPSKNEQPFIDKVEVTLAVEKGTLNLGSVNNLSDLTGNGTKSVNFKGKVADINAALNGLTYVGDPNYNGNDTLTITTNDLGNFGTGEIKSDIDTIPITINPINDPPGKPDVPDAQSVGEDTELFFNTANNNLISISDIDTNNELNSAPVDEVQVTLSVQKGKLAINSTPNNPSLVVENNDSANVIIKGKIEDINTALDGLGYQGNENFNGKDILSIEVNDLDNGAKQGDNSGTPFVEKAEVEITVNAANDAPENTIPDAQNVDEDTNLVFSTSNKNAITVGDIDFNPDKNEQPFIDKVEVTLTVTKGTLNLGSVNNVSEMTGNGTKSVNFKGKVADINAALNGLTYLGDTNYNGEDTLTITTNDLGNFGTGEIKSDIDTIPITINPINDPPVNADVPDAQIVDEDTKLFFNNANNNLISISDVDVDNELNFDPVDEVKVTLSVQKGKVTVDSTPGNTNLVVENNNSANVIVKGKVEDINTVLDGLSYQGDDNFNGKDTLKIEVNDLDNGKKQNEETNAASPKLATSPETSQVGQLFSRAEVDITVNAVNDAPENNIPTTFDVQTVNEDTQLVFNTSNNNLITVEDIDFDPNINEQPFTDNLEATLAVEKGTINLGSVNNLSELTGDGSKNISFKGKVADINAALDGLTYLGDTNYNGEDKLTITTNDFGNSGTGEIKSDTDAIAIKVKPVNDAPVNKVPQAQEVDEDEKLFFNRENGNVLSLKDIDADEGTGEVKVTLSVKNGTLTLAKAEGLTFEAGNGDADATVTFRGKISAVNKALDGMFYLGNKDFYGAETLTFTTDDQKNFGDVARVDTDIINITVLRDSDADGVNDRTEDKIAAELENQEFTDSESKNLSKRATLEGGIAALYSGEKGTQPILIAIDDRNQQELSDSESSALTITDASIKSLKKFVSNPVTVFDKDDRRKSSVKEIKSGPDVIDFKIKLNPEITDDTQQQQIKDGIKQKPVKVEIKLPDDITVNTILQRKADGTLYDLRREFNPRKNELEYDMLTGVVLQDRDLDGKADWAVLYLQDGEWGDEDGLVNGEIAKSLVFANLDLGTSRMEVRSNRDGLNFYGNKNYVKFSLSSFSGNNVSEIGMARVRFGDDGEITEVNGKAISSLDEAKQEIIQKGKTLFSSLKNKRNPDFGTQSRTIAFEEGEQAVFFVIQDGTRSELLFNGLTSKTVQFSLSGLNSDGNTIFQASSDETGQTSNISLAGLFDIEAKILTTEEVKSEIGLLALRDSESEVNNSGKLIDLNSSGAFNDKKVTLKFSLQREAKYNNSAYLYKVDDINGSILDPVTGNLIDPTNQLSGEQKQRYLELVRTQRLVEGVQFETSNFTTTEISVTLDGGGYYVPFLVSDGTISSIENDLSRILTPYMGANSNSSEQVRSLGNGIFGFEDTIGTGSDRDFNDMILSINQVDVVG
ncbi:MAG: DUF4347 domain-containing protein [Cyanobacteria bacterium P01_A01_bin.80]